MDEPLVSIVIPVYNVEKYLADCLDSVLEQDYTNLQVIAVNDGSNDGSSAILNSYTDKRLEIVDKINGGLSSARNAGLKCARGEYLCFVDSDDVINQSYIRELLKGLKDQKSDLAICALKRFADDVDIFANRTGKEEVSWTVYPQDDAIRELYGGEHMQQLTVACSKLYPRKIYEKISFPEGRLHEDVAVSLEVLLQANRIAITSAPLYLYRSNPRSITSTPSWKHMDGIDFYEKHAWKLHNQGSNHANLALLAAFKTGITCLADYSSDGYFCRDRRYRDLQERVTSIARRVSLRDLRAIDIATVLVARISITLATAVYRAVLSVK